MRVCTLAQVHTRTVHKMENASAQITSSIVCTASCACPDRCCSSANLTQTSTLRGSRRTARPRHSAAAARSEASSSPPRCSSVSTPMASLHPRFCDFAAQTLAHSTSCTKIRARGLSRIIAFCSPLSRELQRQVRDNVTFLYHDPGTLGTVCMYPCHPFFFSDRRCSATEKTQRFCRSLVTPGGKRVAS